MDGRLAWPMSLRLREVRYETLTVVEFDGLARRLFCAETRITAVTFPP